MCAIHKMISLQTGLPIMVLFVVALPTIEADEIPQFTKHPQSAIIKVLSKVSLHCEVAPNTTDIYWLYKDRRITSDTPNVYISGGDLVIESLQNSSVNQPGSEGLYRCLASNSVGTVLSLEASLEAAYTGEFYEVGRDVYSNVTEGNVALISCPPISGRPRPYIHYELNGTRLDTDKDGYYVLPSGGLQIANVTPRHSGLYRCVAYNPVSGETKRAKHLVHLNVITPMIDHPPVFLLVPPHEVKAVSGHDLTLECVVEGAPVPVVTWSKYGGKLPNGRYKQVLGNLQLYDIGRLDEGTYICTAHNNVGQQQVAIAELKVQEPPTLHVAPISQHVALAASVNFSCQGRGKPAVTVEWFHNGQKLKTGKGIVIVNDTMMTARRVNTKQSGIYQCIIKNNFGAISGAAQLSVGASQHGDGDRSKRRREQNEKMQGMAPDVDPVHPFIVTLPQNTTIYEGGATVLPCGTHERRVQYGENFLWLRNSATIEHIVIDRSKGVGQTMLRRAPQSAGQRSELRVLDSGSLQIINAQLVDSGEYTCVLWIDGSSDSASAFLTVKALGGAQQKGEHSNQSSGGATEHGSSKDSGATSAKRDDIIALGDHNPRDNELIPPSRPDVVKLTDTSVMLEWHVPDNNGLPVTFFKVQYKELVTDKQRRRWRTIDEDIPSHVRQFELMALKPGSTYRFRIVAVYSNNDNKHGPNSRKFTMTRSAAIQPKVPLEGPVIVEARPISQNTIALKWQYEPDDWTPLDGFTVYYQIYQSHDEPQTITVHGSHVRETAIDHLLPNTLYKIRMKGFNPGGESQFSNTVVQHTLEFNNGYHGDDQSRLTEWPALIPAVSSSTAVPPSVDFNPSMNTEESNKMLYIILGCVLGILVIFLLFFMAMCAWKQQQRARLFAGRNKFEDQSRAIYTEENIRQKQFNGNGLLLNGLNGFTVQSNNLTNGHTTAFSYPRMNITSNPLTENQRTSPIHLNYTSNSNNKEYMEHTSGQHSPVSDVCDPSKPQRQNFYTEVRDQTDSHMVTFGHGHGRQPNHATPSDHLYDQPPEYPSIGSQKSRDHIRMPSPQVSVHSQSSSSYRVHDPYMTDHIPRSHERPQHQQLAGKIKLTNSQRLAQREHNPSSHVSVKRRHASDNNSDDTTDQSAYTDNENTHAIIDPEQSHISRTAHPPQDMCSHTNRYTECDELCVDDREDDGMISVMSPGYHHVDTRSDVSDDNDDGASDCDCITNVPPSIPHTSQVPRLHDYPQSDPED